MNWGQQERQKMAAAFELYCQRPTHENGMILLTFAGDWMSAREFAAFGPCLAIVEVLNERAQFKRSFSPRFVQRWVMPRMLRRFLKPDRPGWNDYYMARWQLTKEQACVREIHRRAVHLAVPHGNEMWAMVRFTAQWMVNSQRAENAEFDAALAVVEKQCAMCRNERLMLE